MSSLSKLIGENVIKEEKGEVSLIESSRFEGSGKILGLYFSAHWCPPCRAFTPQLAEWYKNVKKSSNGDNFDIVFLSSDKNAEGFNEYFKEMPWYAVPYSDRDVKVCVGWMGVYIYMYYSWWTILQFYLHVQSCPAPVFSTCTLP